MSVCKLEDVRHFVIFSAQGILLGWQVGESFCSAVAHLSSDLSPEKNMTNSFLDVFGEERYVFHHSGFTRPGLRKTPELASARP